MLWQTGYLKNEASRAYSQIVQTSSFLSYWLWRFIIFDKSLRFPKMIIPLVSTFTVLYDLISYKDTCFMECFNIYVAARWLQRLLCQDNFAMGHSVKISFAIFCGGFLTIDVDTAGCGITCAISKLADEMLSGEGSGTWMLKLMDGIVFLYFNI